MLMLMWEGKGDAGSAGGPCEWHDWGTRVG